MQSEVGERLKRRSLNSSQRKREFTLSKDHRTIRPFAFVEALDFMGKYLFGDRQKKKAKANEASKQLNSSSRQRLRSSPSLASPHSLTSK